MSTETTTREPALPLGGTVAELIGDVVNAARRAEAIFTERYAEKGMPADDLHFATLSAMHNGYALGAVLKHVAATYGEQAAFKAAAIAQDAGQNGGDL